VRFLEQRLTPSRGQGWWKLRGRAAAAASRDPAEITIAEIADAIETRLPDVLPGNDHLLHEFTL
jgi:hypothetical protein